MMLNVKNSAYVVHTCAILHNLMSLRNHKYYLGDVAEQTDAQGLDPVWHDLRTLADLERLRRTRTREEARAIRDHLKNYYNSDKGNVDWQDATVLRHVSLNNTKHNKNKNFLSQLNHVWRAPGNSMD